MAGSATTLGRLEQPGESDTALCLPAPATESLPSIAWLAADSAIVSTPYARVLLLSHAEYAHLWRHARDRILCSISYGSVACDKSDIPNTMINSALERIDGGPCIELWLSPQRTRFTVQGGFQIADNDFLMFAAAQAGRNEALAVGSETLYAGLLRNLQRSAHPHVVRAWNVLRDINLPESGLERYRQFCIGRHAGWTAALSPGSIPAATAVGSRAGNLTAWFLCATTPGVQIENPRQLSAYRYPETYGPRSPAFARATLWQGPQGGMLFISGTASIVGHESLHLGDATAQTQEALRNIDALLHQAERIRGSAAFKSSSCWLKVYVRNLPDHPKIRAVLTAWLGDDAKVLYLQADICRHELLVEIEGLFF